ncbi:M16 family metallopeptidase [Gemmatimonadota bacterium]
MVENDKGTSLPNGHYQLTTLSNGLTVVTETLPHVRSVAFGVWSRAGSRDEEAGREGTAHFLEHMFFKGSENRSAFDIAYELEGKGGYLNAFTSKDHTCFYAHILDEHLPVAVDVLGDMLQNPKLDPVELEREKQVVLEEIKTSNDTPDDWVHELFLMDLYGEHPLAHPVLGYDESVSGLDSGDLRSFIDSRYRNGNLLVAAAGSLVHEEVVDLVERTFSERSSEDIEARIVIQPGRRGEEFLHYRDISQVHVLLGSQGLPHRHDDRYALVILMNLLGGGMSSRLFQSLREQRGLVYTVSSITSFHEETGLAAFYLACAPENARLALELIAGEIDAISRGGSVSEEELQSSREQVKGHIILALENTFPRMSRLAKGILFEERILSIEETLENIDAVTVDDMVRMAEEILRPEIITTTMLGATKDVV